MEAETPQTEQISQAITNPMTDLENLKNYIQNSEKSKIVEFICKLTNEQRQKLKELYLSSYGTELEKELDSVLSGDAKDLISGLMKNPIDFDAEQIYLSMKGLGTDEDTLSEILATRSSRALIKIKDLYPELYKESLEDAIKGDTSKAYQKILIAIIQGGRSDNPYPDTEKMKKIVENINEETDMQKDNIISYLVNCSYSEICTICRLYEKKYEKNILDMIKKVLDDNDAYNFIKIMLECITNLGKFFAEKIKGFKSKDLIRIFVSQNEENMEEIRDCYKALYNVELIEDIKKETDGDFQTGLCILAQK